MHSLSFDGILVNIEALVIAHKSDLPHLICHRGTETQRLAKKAISVLCSLRSPWQSCGQSPARLDKRIEKLLRSLFHLENRFRLTFGFATLILGLPGHREVKCTIEAGFLCSSPAGMLCGKFRLVNSWAARRRYLAAHRARGQGQYAVSFRSNRAALNGALLLGGST